MALAGIAMTIICTILAYVFRHSDFLLAIFVGLATLALTDALHRMSVLEKQFIWPTLLCATIWRRREVRVSISYLFSIPVQDEQLLIRGTRINTQFQPVGGVFKSYLSDTEMIQRFSARPDSRFSPDAASSHALRVRLPGRNLYKIIRWFRSRKERELFPIREFYGELIEPGHLDRETFKVFDCRFIGLRHFPLKFDTYSQCMQIIVAEVYELKATDEQQQALAALRSQPSNTRPDIHFATNTEIIHRGAIAGSNAQFDLAPTTEWLVRL